MTLDIIIRRVNYTGDDRTTCFSFPFKVWCEEQVVVYCSDPATPWTETNITNSTTITLNKDNYGGAVVFKNPPEAGVNLAIVREGSFLQEDEYISGSRFDAHEVEDRFDEDAAERQELLDATARSIKVPNSSTQTPEEVYQQLIEASIFIQNSLDSLTELYEQAVSYYNLAIGIFGGVTYTKSQEVYFDIEETHNVAEGTWICPLPEGFTYYPGTNQLLVTVDGFTLTRNVHFSEVGSWGEISSQIRFNVSLYEGQQVYIKAAFIGTEEFEIYLNEMKERLQEAKDEIQKIVEEVYQQLIEAEKFIQKSLDSLTELYEQAVNYYNLAIGLFGEGSYTKSQEVYFDIEETHNVAEAPWICPLPEGFTYYPETNQLLVTVDGFTLTRDVHFSEVGSYGNTSSQIQFKVSLYKGQHVYIKASFIGSEEFEIYLNEMKERLQEAKDEIQEIVDATTAKFDEKLQDMNESFEAFITDSENKLNNTISSLNEKIKQVENLVEEALSIVGTAENWQSFQGVIEELNNIYATFTANELPTQGYCVLPNSYEPNSCLFLPENVCYFKNTNTLHLAIDGLVLSPRYFEEIGGCICNETCYYGANYVKLKNINLYQCQELYAWTETFLSHGDWKPEEAEPDITTRLYATSTSGCIYHSDDLSRTWYSDAASSSAGQLLECLQGQRIVATSDTLWALTNGNQEENNGNQDDAASSAKTLMCSTDGGSTWDYYKKEQFSVDCPQAFTTIDNTLIVATCEKIFCYDSESSWCEIGCFDVDDTITAIANNSKGWMIMDASGKTKYAENTTYVVDTWQTGNTLEKDTTCIYGACNGFVALGSGTFCASSSRSAWKQGGNGTLCAGLYLPDHGLYLAVGGDNNCSYTLWSWDGLNWNCGCGIPSNVTLNNIWASEHLPFFVNEPVTKLEAMSLATSNEGSLATSEQYYYFWGPISPTYQLKNDLSFDDGSIPVHITIDQALSDKTDNDYSNDITVAIYYSDTYQRLTRDDILSEILPEAERNQEESLPQMWRKFACYKVCGPISANTELYTCFTAPQSLEGSQIASGRSGSEEAVTEAKSYPTCWPARYYAAAIYNVYGNYSLQENIPNINFYVSRMERFSDIDSQLSESSRNDEDEKKGENNDS